MVLQIVIWVVYSKHCQHFVVFYNFKLLHFYCLLTFIVLLQVSAILHLSYVAKLNVSVYFASLN